MGPRIIVVGSSLGGLETLQAIFSHLPASFDLPIVVAQHRHAQESQLVKFLQQSSSLPILEPMHNEPISGGHIYLAPSDYHLLIEKGSFALSADDPIQHARPSIDLLFQSAAEVYRKAAFGMILSGSGCDGLEGARAIKRCGGQLAVQDPETAQCGVLPLRVLVEVKPDHLLPLQDIAGFLAGLSGKETKHSYVRNWDQHHSRFNSRPS